MSALEIHSSPIRNSTGSLQGLGDRGGRGGLGGYPLSAPTFLGNLLSNSCCLGFAPQRYHISASSTLIRPIKRFTGQMGGNPAGCNTSEGVRAAARGGMQPVREKAEC
ncbi:hypothetical protein DPEC_G00024280 [Dallia pectoralis]|uniref:Uncharacterized protein n=1 Tax=Dallia pectoralis TaxID=75939 RepID=A0ACC2HHV6_DALPE|nr:hypothetical protein DPEC_G00024280 [Dallia pectoralis]